MDEKLYNELLEDLKTELEDDVDFSESVLAVKVKNAIREVRRYRNYKASNFSEEDIVNDLYENYYNTIYNVALYDYSQIGAFGETQHSENGIQRTYQYRDRLFADVTPFVTFI